MKNKREIVESKYPPINNEDLWLKDGKLYHSTSKGWVPLSEEPSITETYEQGVSSISYSGKDGQEHQIELSENVESDVTNIINDTFVIDEDNNITFTDDNDTEHTLVTTDALPSILANNSMLEVTWLLLKDMRDNSQLIAGCLYRITDYNCTTTQEDTRSAGHQFDIVLLALSENKLAEEGWAMEHPTDVYDVTFNDDVTLKCYIYKYNEMMCNIVNIDTLKGVTASYGEGEDVEINGSTAVTNGLDSTDLFVENLTYNYFQNSNLSAWKVWYSLDNDTSRFAWAQNEELLYGVESVFSNGKPLKRCPSYDNALAEEHEFIYAWGTDEDIDDGDPYCFIYSKTIHVIKGDELYKDDVIGKRVTAPYSSGFGTGVIYRLIDEWNNDVPYDFKNILYLRNVDDATIVTDNSGTDIYIPTFCLKDDSTGEYKDASIFAIDYSIDNNSNACCNNKIYQFLETSIGKLNDIVIISYVANEDNIWNCNNFTIECGYNLSFNDSSFISVKNARKAVISFSYDLYIMYLYNTNIESMVGIIRRDKKVVWEDIS